MSIVISGASGDLGRRITSLLLEQLPASRLILLTRNPASLAPLAALGAEVRKADFDDYASLQQAMKGGEVLMLISTLSIGKRAQQHGNAIKAAAAAGIGHIVYTSSCGVQPQSPSLSGQEHLATERLLQKSGLHYTILRNSWYADVIAQLLLPMCVATGSLVSSTGDGLVAPVAKQDCARIAAGVLRKYWQHEQAIYEVTGPELLSFADIAAVMSEHSGKRISFVNVSHQEKLAMFDAMGVQRDYEEGMMNENTNAWASNEMITYEMAIKRQFFSVCSNHVGLVTGQRALSLREVLRQYAA
jgi:NAD(P)H dehydrogenase (quinone)